MSSASSTDSQIRPARYDPRRRGFFYHLSAGLRFFFAGIPVLVRHPSLLALSFVPIVLTLVALASLISAGVWLAGALTPPSTLPFSSDLQIVAQAVVLLLALLLSYLLYLPLARVLLAPFSEAISRRTRTVLGMQPEPHAVGWLRAMLEGAKVVSLQFLLVLTGIGIGIAFPPIAAVLGLVIAICFVSLDYLDVPLSVRGLKLKSKLGVLWRNKALATGFGAAGYLMLIIPVVNLLSLPVGVIGATILVSHLETDPPQ